MINKAYTIRKENRMGYVQSNLMQGETLLYSAKIHWIIFRWAIILAVIGLSLVTAPDVNDRRMVVNFLFLAALAAGWAFAKLVTSEYAITDKRVMMKNGIIMRKSVELLLPKVESIVVKQGVLGRLLGYGSVHLSTAGTTISPFKKIARPLEL